MTFLKTFMQSPLAGAIGWSLLHSLWQGAVISGALAALLVVAHSARLRCLSACAAMLAMLGAFCFTLASLLPEDSHATLLQTDASFRLTALADSGDSTSPNRSLAPLVPWLTPFWITGVSLIYLRRVAGCISVQRLRRRGVCAAPEPWQQRLVELGGKLRVSRPIRLLETSLADAPSVLGHFRPLILFPVGLLAGLPSAQVEAILLHELAHIRRHDYLLNIFQRLAEGLFFYHPAIWWISRLVRVERENCCDDLALSVSRDSHEYASALAALEQRRQAALDPAVAATGGSLVMRIRRVLYPQRSNAPWVPFLAAAIFILVAAVSLAAWQSELPSGGSHDLQPQKQGEASSAYSKWLNEDVVYIIDDEERAAFLRLATDEEREKFIEQFWQRRDPTAGTAQKKAKEEHYRRLAYANSHFGTTSGRPGWQTDRGRIYIVYGKPDELEVHPVGSQATRPYEVWTYRNANGYGGAFTFVDRTGRGDFRLVPGSPQSFRTPSPPPSPGVGTTDDGARVQGIRVSQGVMDKNLVEKVSPVYPQLAQQARIEGTVVLRAVIGRDGSVRDLRVISGHPMLAPAAIEAAKKWRYKPYILNGSPTEVETIVNIPFSLAP